MLSKREMASYGLGAVGKDMVYMFSASYILYYYQDILGVSAIAMGMILMAAHPSGPGGTGLRQILRRQGRLYLPGVVPGVCQLPPQRL